MAGAGRQRPRRRHRSRHLTTFAAVVVVALVGCSSPSSDEDGSDPTLGLEAVGARAVHTATVLSDGSVMVVGGCVVDGCSDATASVVDLAADGSVRPGPDLLGPRDGHTATATSAGVLVAGGYSGEGQPPLASMELRTFDGGWRSFGTLTTRRGGHDAALLGDGRVVVVGGWVGRGTVTDSTELVDLGTGAVTPGPTLPVAADGLTATRLVDGRVLVTGGQVAPRVATPSAALIAADGSGLELVGPLIEPRFKHTAVALPDGRVLVIGGTVDDRVLLSSTEVFDPATLTFSPGPRMLSARYKLTGSATLLPDGRVLVAGGGLGAEVIDVDVATSTPVDDIPQARASFSTVTVWRDSVLVLGGYDERIRLTRLSELLPLGSLPAP